MDNDWNAEEQVSPEQVEDRTVNGEETKMTNSEPVFLGRKRPSWWDGVAPSRTSFSVFPAHANYIRGSTCHIEAPQKCHGPSRSSSMFWKPDDTTAGHTTIACDVRGLLSPDLAIKMHNQEGALRHHRADQGEKPGTEVGSIGNGCFKQCHRIKRLGQRPCPLIDERL
jgi:hypothetical protein